MNIKKVHVVFKTHLDIGFTDLSRSVVSHYLNSYIPAALECARNANNMGKAPMFLWTVGSYLIDYALRTYDAKKRDSLADAIKKGYITYHALPFTTHSELCDETLFRAGLGITSRLDGQFDRKTIAAKMSDVPGHTAGIIAPLCESGVEYLHIGINSVARMPKVPDLFIWENEAGQSVIVNYCRSYGGITQVKGHDEVLYFMHSQDNMGPPSLDHLKEEFASLCAKFPGAQVFASTLDAYAKSLRRIRHTLPVVRGEIGDTWIQGIGTDPKKVSALRALTRLCSMWDKAGIWRNCNTPQQDGRDLRSAFLEELLLICEHTWGLDTKKYLADFKNWNRADFDAARKQNLLIDAYGDVPGCESYYAFAKKEFYQLRPAFIDWDTRSYAFFEASHQEQRQYLSSAAELLPSPLKEEALALIEDPQLDTPALASHQLPSHTLETRLSDLTMVYQPDGNIRLFADDSKGNALSIGPALYQQTGQQSYEKLGAEFLENLDDFRDWAMPDNFKPGLDHSDAPKASTLHAPACDTKMTLQNGAVKFQGIYPNSLYKTAGCPEKMACAISCAGESQLLFTYTLHNKPANRKPESIFLPLHLPQGTKIELQKINTWIDPKDVIPGGNERCHAVQNLRLTLPSGGTWLATPLDTPLLAIGLPELLDFSRPQVWDTIYFALYNNLWGTNFKMWYEEDILCRILMTYEGRKES